MPEGLSEQQIEDFSHEDGLKIIQAIKNRLKNNKTVQNMFAEHGLSLDEIDYIPICFSDLDVSARTDHAIIYLNKNLLKGGLDNIDHYVVHEITHFIQQTTGDGPTEGSTDSTYLDNKYEKEGFQQQSEYISETRDDAAAKRYIDKVLDHHDIKNKKERTERRKELLQLASSSKQLKFKMNDPLSKTKEELDREYDEAIVRGPQENHMRRGPIWAENIKARREFILEELKKLQENLEESSKNPKLQKRLDRKKKMLQLALDFDE